MTKRPITYMGLVKVSLKKLIADGVDRKEAFRQTAKRWQSIKQGSDSEFSHDTSKQPSTRKSKKSKKHKKKHNKHQDEDHDKQCKPIKQNRRKHCKTGKQSKKTKKCKNFDIIMKCIKENCDCKECHDKVEEILSSHECNSC